MLDRDRSFFCFSEWSRKNRDVSDQVRSVSGKSRIPFLLPIQPQFPELTTQFSERVDGHGTILDRGGELIPAW